MEQKDTNVNFSWDPDVSLNFQRHDRSDRSAICSKFDDLIFMRFIIEICRFPALIKKNLIVFI